MSLMDKLRKTIAVSDKAFSVGELCDLIAANQLIFNTEYQRSEVWPTKKKQRLIDSILRKYDISKIFLRQRLDGVFECLDGQQRLRAIHEFINNGFATSKDITTELGTEAFYNDQPTLPDFLKSRVREFVITATLVHNVDEEITSDIFLRLQEGMPLNAPEKLNAISGIMRRRVLELSRHVFFKNLGVKDTRFTHRYLAAQILAIELNDGLPMDVKYRNLEKLYRLYKEVEVPQNIIDHVAGTFNFLNTSLQNDKQVVRFRADVLSIYQLASILRRHYAITGKDAPFHDFLARARFISQTYLMILVRLLLARYLVKKEPPLVESLNGQLFDYQGIRIIEDDFFSWILAPAFWPEVESFVEIMKEALDTYDLDNVDEDIFKEIYQEIVKKGERHRIGEYYTPEWLAELTLREAVKVLDPKNEKNIISMLDPACGSGTFLTNSVSFLRKKRCTLNEILDNVCGVDVNPIAVAISRANYLLALGELIERRKEAISIPIFMADSINLPSVRKELIYGISILAIDVGDKTQLSLPLETALDEGKLKQVLTIFAEILSEYKRQKVTKTQALSAFKKSYNGDSKSVAIIESTLKTLMDLMDKGKDSIWVFMLRNIYAPLRMCRRKFDLVVGNPPWISLRYVENTSYQNFLKKTVFEYGLLSRRETPLFTQMDTSTVFYVKAADNYLAKGGVLAFVMPRSVLTGAKQHTLFKKQKKPLMKIVKILDTEKVNPLFNVDSCSLIAKMGQATVYPVPSVLINGNLPEKNIRLDKAVRYLTTRESEYSPQTVDEARSPYYDKVQNGSGIYPRALWFFKPVQGEFGLNPDRPLIESLIFPDAKYPWNETLLRGEVEREFIFATVTGKNLLPFKATYQAIVLPIRKGRIKWKILSLENLRGDAKFKMADWFESAQHAWEKNGTEKNLKNYRNIMDYLNYNNKLIEQRLDHRYYVVYTASGTNVASALVDTHKLPDFRFEEACIRPSGFVPDVKTFYFSTNNEEEAHYLCSILNSAVLNDKIKRIQTRGKFGPRDIHRRPFEFGIPKFNQNDETHKQIAALGKKAAKDAARLPKTSRLKMKAVIPSMKEIDKLVSELLNA